MSSLNMISFTTYPSCFVFCQPPFINAVFSETLKQCPGFCIKEKKWIKYNKKIKHNNNDSSFADDSLNTSRAARSLGGGWWCHSTCRGTGRLPMTRNCCTSLISLCGFVFKLQAWRHPIPVEEWRVERAGPFIITSNWPTSGKWWRNYIRSWRQTLCPWCSCTTHTCKSCR